MNKILILLLINLIYLNAGTIKAKKVKARDHRSSRSHHRHSSNSLEENILFSSSEVTAHISTELSFELSTEATSYSTMEKRRNRRNSYIESNRKEINIDIAKAKGEHLSTLLKLLEIRENRSFLVKVQKNFKQLSQLNNDELSQALIAMNT